MLKNDGKQVQSSSSSSSSSSKRKNNSTNEDKVAVEKQAVTSKSKSKLEDVEMKKVYTKL